MKSLEFSVAAAALVASSTVMTDELDSRFDHGGECPVTLGTDKLLEPESRNTYGSEALAVALPADGTWGLPVPPRE